MKRMNSNNVIVHICCMIVYLCQLYDCIQQLYDLLPYKCAEHAEELYNQLLIISIVDINMIKVIKVGNTH